MFTLGLISVALHLAGCRSLQDMRLVSTQNIFLTINVTDDNISASDEYMWLNLYIYTSILCSLAHRLLRCPVSLKYTFGWAQLFHNLVNISLGAAEVFLVAFLPLAQKSVVCDECSVIVQYFGAIIEVFYGVTAIVYPHLSIFLFFLQFIYFPFHDSLAPPQFYGALMRLGGGGFDPGR